MIDIGIEVEIVLEVDLEVKKIYQNLYLLPQAKTSVVSLL